MSFAITLLPVPQRRHILILLACGLAVGLYALLSGLREPSYQGKSLSQWVADLDPQGRPESAKAAEAVRHMGTNAIPYLLEWMRYIQPPGKAKCLDAFDNAAYWLQERLGAKGDWGLVDHRLMKAEEVTLAFRVLGEGATNAVVELTRILNKPESSRERFAPSGRAAYALAHLGPLGLPPLVAALASTNARVRAHVAWSLRFLGTNALVAVPQLLGRLADSDSRVARQAAETLAEMKADPPVVIPAMQAYLIDPDPDRRATAALGLAGYGSLARSAVPSLLKARKDRIGTVQTCAEQALLRIAPEALTNAPPK